MPMDRSKYPANWEEISASIRFGRAANKCEQCGAPNNTWIVRSDVDASRFIILNWSTAWYSWPDGTDVEEYPEEFASNEAVKVILTVHHVGIPKPDGTPGSPDDKLDCRPENLLALCQRCHLLADSEHHQVKRHVTLNRKKHEARLDAGQGELL